MATSALAPAELYELPARTANLAAKSDRIPLFIPASADEFKTNGMGGEVVAEGVTTLFCPSGFYTPAAMPGTEGCRRVNLEVPGQPAVAVISWTEPGGALRFKVPGGAGVFSILSALSMRAAIDPLSPLNPEGQSQAFSIQLTDAAGNRATVVTRPDEPALQYPPGLFEEDSFFEGGLFTGRVPLTSLRALLSQFPGVNLAAITEIAVIFDQTPSGSLFFSDLELVRGPVEWRATLSAPPPPELLAAAEAGDVEAQRQLANLYRPTSAMGIYYGSSEQAVYWYRQACAAGYANAQVDFFDFASSYDGPNAEIYLAEATACLEDAIRQGHRMAIINGAFQAAFVNHDYKTGFFLYALLEDSEPHYAEQRWSFAGNLTAAEIDEAEQAAAEWRANNQIKDYDDFFIEVNSPFRVVSPTPAAAP
ncbi:MAG: sel1 repeat family protein [Anaerolineales bacterium]|nr:sel1 repeat family protein [Anaerolineales bacterium]